MCSMPASVTVGVSTMVNEVNRLRPAKDCIRSSFKSQRRKPAVSKPRHLPTSR